MSGAGRKALTIVGSLGVLALLLWGLGGLPAPGDYPGPYGLILDAVAVHQRQIPNIVTAVNFDYRGLDTMGEEFILFAAVTGLLLLLRRDRADLDDAPMPALPGRSSPPRSEAMRLFGVLGVGLTVLFGVYIMIHGPLTPGGGFQGGAVTATGLFVAYLGVGFVAFKRVDAEERGDFLEALGAGSYVALGLAALGVSGAFLTNVLPLGSEGNLYSTGTIFVINLFVGIEVTGGLGLVFLEFARETRKAKIGADRTHAGSSP